MAEYHSTLKELEELVQTRIRLISRGSSHWGVEKCINITLSTLHRENSMPARAEEYCRRLKIVRQQLGGYAMGDLDALIAKQESLVGGSRPNVSKPRSPKFSPPPFMRPVRQSRPADTTDAAPGFAWDHRPPTCRNAWAWPNAAAPQLTPLAPVPGSRAWPGFAARRAAPMAHMPCTWARPNAGRGPRAAPLPPPVPGAWPTPSHHHALPVVTPRRESSSLREPPALRISVLRINGRTKKYRSNLGYAATDLKIGGFHQADKYTGFTHWLLTDPRQVGAVKWSRNSSLAIVQSREHGHNGDTLHIQTDSKEDVRALADYMSRWYGDGGTQVVEIGREELIRAFKKGVS